MDAHHVNAVVQVLAERALGNHLPQVAMSGKDQACLQRDQSVAPQAAELSLLQYTQQLHLD